MARRLRGLMVAALAAATCGATTASNAQPVGELGVAAEAGEFPPQLPSEGNELAAAAKDGKPWVVICAVSGLSEGSAEHGAWNDPRVRAELGAHWHVWAYSRFVTPDGANTRRLLEVFKSLHLSVEMPDGIYAVRDGAVTDRDVGFDSSDTLLEWLRLTRTGKPVPLEFAQRRVDEPGAGLGARLVFVERLRRLSLNERALAAVIDAIEFRFPTDDWRCDPPQRVRLTKRVVGDPLGASPDVRLLLDAIEKSKEQGETNLTARLAALRDEAIQRLSSIQPLQQGEALRDVRAAVLTRATRLLTLLPERQAARDLELAVSVLPEYQGDEVFPHENELTLVLPGCIHAGRKNWRIAGEIMPSAKAAAAADASLEKITVSMSGDRSAQADACKAAREIGDSSGLIYSCLLAAGRNTDAAEFLSLRFKQGVEDPCLREGLLTMLLRAGQARDLHRGWARSVDEYRSQAHEPALRFLERIEELLSKPVAP